MTKHGIISFSIFFVLVAFSYAFFMPETLRQMEASDFFQCTSDFFVEKMQVWHSFSLYLTNFLLQFFSVPVLAGIIYALVLTLVGILGGIIPSLIGYHPWEEKGLLFPLAILIFIPFNLEVDLYALFFLGFIDLCLWIKNRWVKMGCMVLLGCVGWLLTTWMLAFFAEIIIVVVSIIKKEGWLIAVAGVVGIVLSVFSIWLYSDNVGFIPFLSRFFVSPTNVMKVWPFAALFVAGVIIEFIPTPKPRTGWKWYLPIVGAVVLTCVALKRQIGSQHMDYTEQCYRWAKLAETGQWQKLLEDARPEEQSKKIALCYSLLAESALGTLPDNLLSYHIIDPNDMLYRFETTKFTSLFNRLFYDNLGLYDEAYRQAFEYGVMTPDGICLSSVRNMAHYSILLGEYKLAEKYLSILDQTLMNGSFVEKERKLLAERKITKPVKKPYVADVFVNVYPFNSEMIRILETDPSNKKALDNLLCGLLLQGELQKFSIIMDGFSHHYKDKQIPNLYAEAAAMLANDPQLTFHGKFNYDLRYDEAFATFYNKHRTAKNPMEMAQYKGSYWYFFFMRPQVNGEQQRQQKTVN